MVYKNKKNKYGNKKINTLMGSFDSKLELNHYETLCLLEKAGKISDLDRQVSIKLAKSPSCRIVYKADFVYYDIKDKEWVIMDSKGFVTDSFRLKKAWLLDNFINFKFVTKFKNIEKIEYPFNNDGVDFEKYLKSYKILDKVKNICYYSNIKN